MKTLVITSLAIAAAVSVLTACGVSGSSEPIGVQSSEVSVTGEGEKIILKMAHIGSEDHQYNIGCEILNDLLQAKTDGRIQIQVFPNAQLGAEREAIEGVIMGSIDMTTVTMDGAVPAWVPDTAVMSIPYLFDSKEDAYNALDNYIGPMLETKYEEAGLKCLGFMELGFRHFTNNKRPIHTASDMKGLIIRVQEAPIWFGLCDTLGAVATPVAINELYTALQQGVVDGQENPLGTIVTSKFYEVQKYVTLDGHTYGAGSIFMNKNRWDSLSETDQKIIQECIDEMIPLQRDKVTKMEDEYKKILRESGTIIDEEPDISSFVTATEGIEKKPDIVALFNDISIVQGVRDYLMGK